MPSSSPYIRPILSRTINIGGKVKGLQFLIKQGIAVPNAYICRSEAFQKWRNGEEVLEHIREELNQIIDEKKYIVRSSAELEDTTDFSFAGQFNSIAMVKGVDEVINGIQEVWRSSTGENVIDYINTQGLNSEFRLSVIIQEMIEAEYSGVVFTKNPMNGLDMVIVEGIEGNSEKILQAGIDPDRWVYRWGKFVERSNNAIIKEEIIKEIIETSQKIEKSYGNPVDLEWVYSEEKVWWIQLREITTIDKKNFYSNQLSKQHLPGLIKPLVWSVNIPLVCGAWIHLLDEITGGVELKPNQMAKQFYYRAYYNMSALGKEFEKLGIPRDSLEVLNQGYNKGVPKPRPPLNLLPRILRFILSKSFFENRLEKHIQKSKNKLNELENRKPNHPKEALEYIEELFEYNTYAAYYVIISQILHQIFYTILHNRLIKKGQRIENFYIEKLPLEINPYQCLEKLSDNLKITGTKTSYTEFLSLENNSKMFSEFMTKFGHLRDSGNDFSLPSWNETPELVFQMIKDLKFDQTNSDSIKIRGWLAKKVLRLYELREIISFNYIKSYGLFRKHFLEIGSYLEKENVLENTSDIFYLSYDKVKEIISNGIKEDQITIVSKIKKDMKQAEIIEVPTEIYGDVAPVPIQSNQNYKELSGIPASGGYYKGKICYVKSMKDFSSVFQGDIVVIPYSDISWIPVLSKAGAIISESGGILSHAAIISREYGVPSVLGVKNAFQIPNGSLAHIDGYLGIIKIID